PIFTTTKHWRRSRRSLVAWNREHKGSPVSHGHAHDHGHGAVSVDDRRPLAAALALIAAFMVGEVIAGIIAGSLALLADGGHMLADAAALALALVAASLARRPAEGRWTFGFRRVEILAAQLNGLTLLLVGAWIVYEAVRRLANPIDVDGSVMVTVAVV